MRTQCSSYVIDTKKTDTSQMEKRLPGQDIFLLRNSRMLTLTAPKCIRVIEAVENLALQTVYGQS